MSFPEWTKLLQPATNRPMSIVSGPAAVFPSSVAQSAAVAVTVRVAGPSIENMTGGAWFLRGPGGAIPASADAIATGHVDLDFIPTNPGTHSIVVRFLGLDYILPDALEIT